MSDELAGHGSSDPGLPFWDRIPNRTPEFGEGLPKGVDGLAAMGLPMRGVGQPIVICIDDLSEDQVVEFMRVLFGPKFAADAKQDMQAVDRWESEGGSCYDQ